MTPADPPAFRLPEPRRLTIPIGMRFAVLSFLCVAALAIATGYAFSSVLTRAISDSEGQNTAAHVEREIELAGLHRLFAAPQTPASLERWDAEVPRLFAGLPEIVRIKVWDRNGTVLWSDEPKLIGQRFPENRELRQSLDGRVSVEIRTLEKPEHTWESGRFPVLAEIYVPIRSKTGGPVVGVLEIYKNPTRLFAAIAWGRFIVWAVSLSGGLLLYLVLQPLVRHVYGRDVQEKTLRVYSAQLERDVASAAARNSELLQELKARQARLEALLDVARELSAIQPLESVLERIAAACGQVLDSDSVGFRLVEGDELVVSAMWGDALKAALTPRLKIGQGMSGAVAATGAPLIVSNVADDPRVSPAQREALRQLGHRVWLGVPVKIGERLVGVLTTFTRREDGFSPDDVASAMAFASHAAIALENARLYAEQEIRAARLRALARLNQFISSSLDTADLFLGITRAGAELMGASGVAIWIANETTKTLELGALSDDQLRADHPGYLRQFGHGATGRTAADRSVLNVPDVFVDPRVQHPDWFRTHGLTSYLGVPIVLGDSLVGVLAIFGRKPFRFGVDEQDLLDSFVAQAAVAIRNARLYAAERQRAQEMEVSLSIAHALSSTLEFKPLLKELARRTAQAIGAERCTINLWGAGHFVPVMSQFADGHTDPVLWERFKALGQRRMDEATVQAEALRSKRPVVLEDVARDRPRWTETFGVRSAMIVPLVHKDQVIGTLTLDDTRGPRPWSQPEIDRAMTIASHVALAVENARLYEAAGRERRNLQVLYDVARRLAAVQETDEVLALIANETARLLAADAVSVRLRDGDSLVLRALTESARDLLFRGHVAREASLSGLVMTSEAPVTIENLLREDRYDPTHLRLAIDNGFRSFLGVRLRAHGATIGTFNVFSKTPRRFSADEVSLVSAFADQAALALDQQRLFNERRQAADALRQSEKLASMGQLLAGVAHELNNPLTVIVGYTTLLRRRAEGGPLARQAKEIGDAAERCTRIVRNFLALARKQSPVREHVNLYHVIHEALELLAYPLRMDNVEVVVDVSRDLPTLWADPQQLQQVIVNLVSNAHQAMRQTSGSRRVALSSRFDPTGRRVFLEVADTGPGISPEIQWKIFEPFFTTKAVGEGTGLGLSLCQGIVEAHGGSIHVRPGTAGGAIFVVELPVESPPAIVTVMDAAQTPPPAKGKRILVVDDERAIASMLADMLGTIGCHVDTAANGEIALTKLHHASYDLILSDVKMPVLDGPSLYQHLARTRPELLPRFIFVTGDTLNTETRKFLEETQAPNLNKPFDLDEVRRVVHGVLQTV